MCSMAQRRSAPRDWHTSIATQPNRIADFGSPRRARRTPTPGHDCSRPSTQRTTLPSARLQVTAPAATQDPVQNLMAIPATVGEHCGRICHRPVGAVPGARPGDAGPTSADAVRRAGLATARVAADLLQPLAQCCRGCLHHLRGHRPVGQRADRRRRRHGRRRRRTDSDTGHRSSPRRRHAQFRRFVHLYPGRRLQRHRHVHLQGQRRRQLAPARPTRVVRRRRPHRHRRRHHQRHPRQQPGTGRGRRQRQHERGHLCDLCGADQRHGRGRRSAQRRGESLPAGRARLRRGQWRRNIVVFSEFQLQRHRHHHVHRHRRRRQRHGDRHRHRRTRSTTCR